MRPVYIHYQKFFSPINLSYVNLVVRPAKEPRRVEKIFFLPYNINLVVVVCGLDYSFSEIGF